MKNLHKIKKEQSILTITVGFAILSEVFEEHRLLLLAIAIGIVGVFSKKLSLLIHKGWMSLSSILGLIIPNIVLAIVFYLILTPIALFRKLIGGNSQYQMKNETSTLFKKTNYQHKKADFEKIW